MDSFNRETGLEEDFVQFESDWILEDSWEDSREDSWEDSRLMAVDAMERWERFQIMQMSPDPLRFQSRIPPLGVSLDCYFTFSLFINYQHIDMESIASII